MFSLSIVGGMLALGAQDSKDKEKYVKLGGDLAHTCHESYIRSGRSPFWSFGTYVPRVLYSLR